MKNIKENGYITWKGLFTSIGGILLAMFLYVDNKMLTKAQFEEFKVHVITSLNDIKKEVRYNRAGNAQGGP